MVLAVCVLVCVCECAIISCGSNVSVREIEIEVLLYDFITQFLDHSGFEWNGVRVCDVLFFLLRLTLRCMQNKLLGSMISIRHVGSHT